MTVPLWVAVLAIVAGAGAWAAGLAALMEARRYHARGMWWWDEAGKMLDQALELGKALEERPLPGDEWKSAP